MAETGIRVGIDGSGAESGARVVKRSFEDIANSAEKTTSSVDLLQKAINYAAGAFAAW